MKLHLILLIALLSIVSCNKKADKKSNGSSIDSPKMNAYQPQKGDGVFMTSDSVSIKYNVAGTGVPCLYIHGGPGQGYDSFKLMKGDRLEEHLTMIYYDQRGSGHSGNAKEYHMDAMMDDIEALRKHLGIEKFFVLTHSFGGLLATTYANRYPEHVAGLMLANCTLHFFNEETTKEQIQFADSLLNKKPENIAINSDSLLPIFLNLRKELSKKHMAYRFITDDVNSIIKMEEIDSLHPRTIDFGMAVITKPEEYPEYYKDYAPMTKSVTVRTLVITGRNDHAVGINHYKTFQFPLQMTASLAGGHLLYYEENERFCEAIWDFVKTQSTELQITNCWN